MKWTVRNDHPYWVIVKVELCEDYWILIMILRPFIWWTDRFWFPINSSRTWQILRTNYILIVLIIRRPVYWDGRGPRKCIGNHQKHKKFDIRICSHYAFFQGAANDRQINAIPHRAKLLSTSQACMLQARLQVWFESRNRVKAAAMKNTLYLLLSSFIFRLFQICYSNKTISRKFY